MEVTLGWINDDEGRARRRIFSVPVIAISVSLISLTAVDYTVIKSRATRLEERIKLQERTMNGDAPCTEEDVTFEREREICDFLHTRKARPTFSSTAIHLM